MNPLDGDLARWWNEIVKRGPTEPVEPEPAKCPYCHQVVGQAQVRFYHPDGRADYKPCPVCTEPLLRARRIERVLGKLEVPPTFKDKTIDDYRSWGRCDPDAVEYLATAEANPPASYYLFGPAGAGKSTVAWAIIQSWVKAGGITSASYQLVPDFINRLRASYDPDPEHSYTDLMHAAEDADILVMDDLGRGRIRSGDAGDWIREQLFLLIDKRQTYSRPTIYTSNYAMNDLVGKLEDPIVDRLHRHCGNSVIYMGGRRRSGHHVG